MSTATNQPRNFNSITVPEYASILTSQEIFNRFFSKKGGMRLKSVIFVTGNSGAGKTTTLINLMNWVDVSCCLYEREMELDEIKDQISPLTITNPLAKFADKSDFNHFDDFMEYVNTEKPKIVIVDSIQAIADSDFIEMGHDAAINYIRLKLTDYTKQNSAVCFIIGHNTKDDNFAGKNTIVQMVDAHLVFEYDKKTKIRKMFWGTKNRKGPDTVLYYEIHDGSIQLFESDTYSKAGEDFNLLEMLDGVIDQFHFNISNKENYEFFQKVLIERNKAYQKFLLDNNKSTEIDIITNYIHNMYVLAEAYNLLPKEN